MEQSHELLELCVRVERDELQLLDELRFVLKLANADDALAVMRDLKPINTDVRREKVRREDEAEMLDEIEQCVLQLGLIAESRFTSGTGAIVETAADSDSVVSFNVRGTVVSTLRSTLRLGAPESFLARRVSGLWTEQEGDLDEDGHMLQVSVSVSAFHATAPTCLVRYGLSCLLSRPARARRLFCSHPSSSASVCSVGI